MINATYYYFYSLDRNLNVAEDDDHGKDADEDGGDIISGLHCKIVVQYEKHGDFYNALKILCGRSLQKVVTFFPLYMLLFWCFTGSVALVQSITFWKIYVGEGLVWPVNIE